MKLFRRFVKVLIFIFIVFVICVVGLYTYAYLSSNLDIKSPNNIQILDKDGNTISYGSGKVWTKLKDISPYLINAVISIEDKNFYKHHGFDYLRIGKAMIENVKNKSIVQGASTISQQYIKNLYLNFDKTWKRKFEEAFLTLQLEVHYSKDEILEGYLNTINYGKGNYGITSAAKYYFDKLPSDLSLEESIILAGIPKNPSKYNPLNHYDNCINRAWIVAKSMLKNNYISKKEYNSLFKDKIEIESNLQNKEPNMLMYYNDAVLEELHEINKIPQSLINSKGLKIYTYYDEEAQKSLERAINNNLSNTEIQVASIIADPNTGGIIALSGGKDYNKSQFNRATQAKRQVGSTMKTFLYYAALENNFVSSTTFSSEETTFNLSNGQSYSPHNYNDSYANKEITMAAAIALSDNIYAIKTNLFLGPETMIEVAKRTGINGKLNPIVSAALGTNELTMKDYANGYLAFASGGYKKKAHLIRKVEDGYGNIIFERENQQDLILNPNYVFILNEMLCNTYNKAFKDYTVPSALSISTRMNHKYAIKTGTTNTDYWISGYNPNALMMVWVGYDDNRNVKDSDSMYSKNIWVDTIEEYLKNKEDIWYEKPSNIVAKVLDSITGKEVKNENKAALYYFVKGSENTTFLDNEKKD